MSDTPPQDIPVEAVALLGELMAAEHAHTNGILNSFVVDYKARLDAVEDGVRAALGTSVWGGTTAEYEMTLRAVEAALYPSHERIEKYRQKAEAWLHGDPVTPV